MAQSHKQHERALRGPDQFQKTAMNAFNWLAANPAYVWGTLGPILILVLAWTGWNFWNRSQAEGRQEELGQVEAVYQDEIKVIADKSEALRKQQDDIDVKLTKETDAKKKDELNAQRKTFDSQITALKPDHSGSLQGYLKFFAKYPSKPEGWVAAMRSAAIHVQKKDFAAAKELLTQVAASSKSEKFFQVQSKLMLAAVSEELGDMQGALTEISSLEPKVDDRLKPQVLLTKARLQIALDQKDEATKTLGVILEKHGASQEADRARSIKALYLGG